MTKKTETIQIEEEVNVTVCDYCGLGDNENDGDVHTLVDPEYKEREVDLHDRCREKFVIEEYESPPLSEVTNGAEGPLMVAFSWLDLIVYSMAVFGIGFFVYDSLTNFEYVGAVLVLLLTVLTGIIIVGGYRAANEGIEELLSNYQSPPMTMESTL